MRKIKFGGLLVLSSAFVLAAAARSDEPKSASNPNVLAQFKIDESAKEILLPVKLGGKEYLFQLDTGASTTMFDISLRDKLPAPKGTAKVKTPSGIIECELFDAPRAFLGPLSWKGTVGVVDFEHISSANKRKRHGTIGMDFLKEYCVQIDFDKGVVSFLKSKPDRGIFSFLRLRPSKNKHPEWGERISIRDDSGSGIPHIAAKAEGVNLDFKIDSGYIHLVGRPDLPFANYTGQLESRVLNKLRSKINFESEQSLRTTGKGKDSFDSGKGAIVSRFSIGALEYKDAVFREGGESVLGMGFLSRHFVTFDFPNDKMYLKRGRYFDSPSAVGFSLEDFGFSLRCRQKDIFVSEVDPNGPAYAKGMRQQDVVIRVDDVDVASHTLSELWPLLSQKDKEELTITIKRGDDIKPISFSLQMKESENATD
jgi:hypothetical protein